MKECLICKAKNPNKAVFCCMCGSEEFVFSGKTEDEKYFQKIIGEELLKNSSLFRSSHFNCDAYSYNKDDESFKLYDNLKHCSYLALNPINATFNKIISWMKKFEKKNPEVIYHGKVYCNFYHNAIDVDVYLPFSNFCVDIAHLHLEYTGKSFLSQLKKLLPLLDNPKTLNVDVKSNVETLKKYFEGDKEALSLSKKIYKETQKRVLAETKSNEEEQ